MARLPCLLTEKDINGMDEVAYVHQFNDNAIRHTRSLGDELGLTNMGVHLVRVEPGHDSTQFHHHHCDEEFVYILSGSGLAEIGDQLQRVEAGDFMAFPQHSPAHNLHNDGTEDLVYLMGGTRETVDVCDYPKINRRMFRLQGRREYVELDNVHEVQKAIQPNEE